MSLQSTAAGCTRNPNRGGLGRAVLAIPAAEEDIMEEAVD